MTSEQQQPNSKHIVLSIRCVLFTSGRRNTSAQHITTTHPLQCSASSAGAPEVQAGGRGCLAVVQRRPPLAVPHPKVVQASKQAWAQHVNLQRGHEDHRVNRSGQMCRACVRGCRVGELRAGANRPRKDMQMQTNGKRQDWLHQTAWQMPTNLCIQLHRSRQSGGAGAQDGTPCGLDNAADRVGALRGEPLLRARLMQQILCGVLACMAASMQQSPMQKTG